MSQGQTMLKLLIYIDSIMSLQVQFFHFNVVYCYHNTNLALWKGCLSFHLMHLLQTVRAGEYECTWAMEWTARKVHVNHELARMIGCSMIMEQIDQWDKVDLEVLIENVSIYIMFGARRAGNHACQKKGKLWVMVMIMMIMSSLAHLYNGWDSIHFLTFTEYVFWSHYINSP